MYLLGGAPERRDAGAGCEERAGHCSPRDCRPPQLYGRHTHEGMWITVYVKNLLLMRHSHARDAPQCSEADAECKQCWAGLAATNAGRRCTTHACNRQPEVHSIIPLPPRHGVLPQGRAERGELDAERGQRAGERGRRQRQPPQRPTPP